MVIFCWNLVQQEHDEHSDMDAIVKTFSIHHLQDFNDKCECILILSTKSFHVYDYVDNI